MSEILERLTKMYNELPQRPILMARELELQWIEPFISALDEPNQHWKLWDTFRKVKNEYVPRYTVQLFVFKSAKIERGTVECYVIRGVSPTWKLTKEEIKAWLSGDGRESNQDR